MVNQFDCMLIRDLTPNYIYFRVVLNIDLENQFLSDVKD
jgi:hypothetical protein